MGEALARAGAKEDMFVAVFARQGGKDLHRAIGERHAMLAARLRARRPGTVQSFVAKSISDHIAPIVSPVLAAVRMVNSSARADTLSIARSFAMNSGTSP